MEELETVAVLRHEKRLDNSRRLVRQADANYIYLQLNNTSPQISSVKVHGSLLQVEPEPSIKPSEKGTRATVVGTSDLDGRDFNNKGVNLLVFTLRPKTFRSRFCQ